MNTKMTKTSLLKFLTGIFVGSLLISNILAIKVFTVVGNVTLTCGVLIFPIVYIVNDVLAEIYGFKKSRSIIYLGFAMNAIAALVYFIAIQLPSPVYLQEVGDAFKIILGSTPRLLVASFAAYLVGSLSNSWIMVRMKAQSENKLMWRCMLSTFIGEGLDSIIFVTIAFLGTLPISTLLIMILSQAVAKTVFEFVVYPITHTVIKRIKTLED